MIAILKKELRSYFGTWNAFIVISLFSVICALFLFFFENNFNIFDIGSASMESFFNLSPWVLVFVIPALSMRSIADEEQSGTLEWLFAQPLKIRDILLGKYLSVCLMGVACLAPSLFCLYSVYALGIQPGNLDLGMSLGGYIGLLLLIGAFASVGVFTSSIFNNQLSAYISGLFINFVLWFGMDGLASYRLLGNADFIVQNLGFQYHFLGFSKGLIDSRDLSYFMLVIGSFLSASFLLIKRKK